MNNKKIDVRGWLALPNSIKLHAETIKLDNYKTNTPKNFQKETLVTSDGLELMERLGSVINVDPKKLDYVYFSACKGAEEHTDDLNGLKFEDTTFVIPVIIPSGLSLLTAEDEKHEMSVVGSIYEFDHTKPHGLELEDEESGCVMIMVAIVKDSWLEQQELEVTVEEIHEEGLEDILSDLCGECHDPDCNGCND
jgi:hypothetical protein